MYGGGLSPMLPLRDDFDIVHGDGYLGVARHVGLVTGILRTLLHAHAIGVEAIGRVGLMISYGASHFLNLVSANDLRHPCTRVQSGERGARVDPVFEFHDLLFVVWAAHSRIMITQD